MAVGTLVAAVLMGCSGEADSRSRSASSSVVVEPDSGPVGVRDATVVWSSGVGVDLFDGRGRMVRAAKESDRIGFMVGLSATYPGFADAVEKERARYYANPNLSHRPLVGTHFWHILEIVDTAAGFSATVCAQDSRSAVLKDDGRYVGDSGPASSYQVTFERAPVPPRIGNVLFEPRTQDPGVADPGDQPQWQYLTEDVFAGWSVTLGGNQSSKWPCMDWGFTVVPDTPKDGTETVFSDIRPLTLPAYPGW
ncbi:hypothetical protein [Rhodococcus sp. ARC_M6]|uniref:hypothetical protein n=1 Tax=Rhodococcus sp. ARC_M6 TaxID=2928852 RepID=UPI001FB45B9D|nr:hypothetical protein [Rhodococcus sp. ARC_M6]MCJ0906383.1 hypothetical protein [Rhodococcus sp. ARC_M6]